jgi:hypothetical protein
MSVSIQIGMSVPIQIRAVTTSHIPQQDAIHNSYQTVKSAGEKEDQVVQSGQAVTMERG